MTVPVVRNRVSFLFYFFLSPEDIRKNEGKPFSAMCTTKRKKERKNYSHKLNDDMVLIYVVLLFLFLVYQGKTSLLVVYQRGEFPEVKMTFYINVLIV